MNSRNSLGVKLSEPQKKLLEKVYARIFETSGAGATHVTEEGRNLCREADVRPDDLKIRTLDDFKNQVGVDEVA